MRVGALILTHGEYDAMILSGRPSLFIAFVGVGLLLCGCLGANPNTQTAAPPAATTTLPATSTAVPASATATLVSQAQPGFSGKVISGTVSLAGNIPPTGSTLFLALVKSANDPQPRPCIDAQRNPVNEQGQFYAQVACTPQPGDQLSYVLIVGAPAARDWHPGVVPLPSDLTNVRLDAPQ
jgi:hypothetical protein